MLIRSLITITAIATTLLLGCVDDDADSETPSPTAASLASAAAQPSLSPSTSATTATLAAPTESRAPSVTIPTSCAAPYPPGPPTAATVFCADPSAMQRVSVVRIVDGDTLRAIVDGVEEPIRLFGVDTPERGDDCFDEATEALRRLVDENGGTIRLLPNERNRDSYDRLLRYVYTPSGLSIDAVLIAEGYGYAWTRDGALRDALIDVEAVARLDGRGCLWG